MWLTLCTSPLRRRKSFSSFETTYLASPITFTLVGQTLRTPPLDLWVYQEIMHQIAPDPIIADTENAGYLASLYNMTGTGEVLAIGVATTNETPPPARLRSISDPHHSTRA